MSELPLLIETLRRQRCRHRRPRRHAFLEGERVREPAQIQFHVRRLGCHRVEVGIGHGELFAREIRFPLQFPFQVGVAFRQVFQAFQLRLCAGCGIEWWRVALMQFRINVTQKRL